MRALRALTPPFRLGPIIARRWMPCPPFVRRRGARLRDRDRRCRRLRRHRARDRDPHAARRPPWSRTSCATRQRRASPRPRRAAGDGDRAAPRVRARVATRARLREPAAADRPRPDHLAAVHRRVDDRSSPRRRRTHRVLEVGTGSGYQAAVLAELAGEVYTIEIIEPLATQAAQRCARSAIANVRTRIGDGYYGWKEAAPFDAIVVTAAARQMPPPLVAQLKPGGRMVIPVGCSFFTQTPAAGDEGRARARAHAQRAAGALRAADRRPLSAARMPARALRLALRDRADLGGGAGLPVAADALAGDRALASVRGDDHQPRAARPWRERHRAERAGRARGCRAVRRVVPDRARSRSR